MKKTNVFLIGVLVFLCFFCFIFIPIKSEKLAASIAYVGGSGLGNYTKIQDALNNMTPHGTIYVYPGVYNEHLIITKPVRLISQHPDNTIIKGDNENYVVTIEAGNSTLSGFTITESKKKFPFAGIYIISNHNTISDNILTDNFYGIQLGYTASYNLIVNNTIFNNERCGIYFNHASFNTLIGNVVSGHPANGFGLYEFSNNNSIINNTFTDNRYTGVNIRESYNTEIIHNVFIQNQVGLHKPSTEYHTNAQDNIFSDNTISIEEERDAFVFTVVMFDILVFFVYLIFKKFIA